MRLKPKLSVHWQKGLILDVQTSKGRIHGFKLYKDTCPDLLPCDTKLLADSCNQGITKLHEQTFIPLKKPRGGPLLKFYKQVNHYLAKYRIMVEHKTGLIKLFKIMAHKYRNLRQSYELIIKLFAGVVSFKLGL